MAKLIKHGHCKEGKRTKIYETWCTMRERCNNPNHKKYKHYGERGITVCKHWNDFRNVLKDMGKKPEGLTLERIDNDKGYSPENCMRLPKFLMYTEQQLMT